MNFDQQFSEYGYISPVTKDKGKTPRLSGLLDVMQQFAIF
jgi:hypothetical protein